VRPIQKTILGSSAQITKSTDNRPQTHLSYAEICDEVLREAFPYRRATRQTGFVEPESGNANDPLSMAPSHEIHPHGSPQCFQNPGFQERREIDDPSSPVTPKFQLIRRELSVHVRRANLDTYSTVLHHCALPEDIPVHLRQPKDIMIQKWNRGGSQRFRISLRKLHLRDPLHFPSYSLGRTKRYKLGGEC
jgi:hypothetical protein